MQSPRAPHTTLRLVPWFVALVAGMVQRAQIWAMTMLNHSWVHVAGGFRGLQHLLNRIFSVCPLPPSTSHLSLSVAGEHLNACSFIAEANCLDSVDHNHMMSKLGDTVCTLENRNFFDDKVDLLLLPTRSFRQRLPLQGLGF